MPIDAHGRLGSNLGRRHPFGKIEACILLSKQTAMPHKVARKRVN